MYYILTGLNVDLQNRFKQLLGEFARLETIAQKGHLRKMHQTQAGGTHARIIKSCPCLTV